MRTLLGMAIITCAVIWAVVIFASSLALEGAPGAVRYLVILGGGAAATIILLGGLLTREKGDE